MNGRPWTDEQIARVKGALLEGFTHKHIAAITGIPISTIGQWAKGVNRAHIEPARFPRESLRDWLTGRINDICADPEAR